jgi:hypothetical protein
VVANTGGIAAIKDPLSLLSQDMKLGTFLAHRIQMRLRKVEWRPDDVIAMDVLTRWPCGRASDIRIDRSNSGSNR